MSDPAVPATPADAKLVADYKKDVCKSYISLNPSQLDERLGGTAFQVTRKLDGELAVLFFDGENTRTVNSGGRVRDNLPVHAAAAAALKAAGLKSAIIACELHLSEEDGRKRVFDVLAALADESRWADLMLAPFDIIEIDGAPDPAKSYTETHAWLSSVFTAPELTPVPMKQAATKAEVKAIFDEWVNGEGAEGLVVRCEMPLVYKVKPEYSLDLAVVGFSESPDQENAVRSMLVAMSTPDGEYQVVGKVGGGVDDEMRRKLHTILAPTQVESSYIETDPNHVAFHMVAPTMVVEVKLNDILFENTSGPLVNPLLAYDGSWKRVGQTQGISIVFPILLRIREDKKPEGTDVRLAQIDEIAAWPYGKERVSADLPASELLRREVYRKELGGKLMVLKFLTWKTNKERFGFPAYVLAHTNFSSERAEALQSEVRISSSEEQINALCDDLIAKNVKKGWVPV